MSRSQKASSGTFKTSDSTKNQPKSSSGNKIPPPTTRASTYADTARTSLTNDNQQLLYETITVTKFEDFQSRIFSIICKIAEQEKYKDNSFAVIWNQAVSQEKPPFNGSSSFRTVQKALPVENLKDYCRLLLECPTLENYVWFRENSKAAAGYDIMFLDQVIPEAVEDTKPPHEPSSGDTTDLSSFEFISEKNGHNHPTQIPFQSCLGTKSDFPKLWTQISLVLNTHATEHPTDPYSIQWAKWKQLGLTTRSSFQDLKRITGIPGLADLYFFLRDSKPLIEFLEFKWDSQILYRLLPEPLIETIATDTSSEGSTTTVDQPSVRTPTTQEEIPVPSGSVITPARSNLSNPVDLAVLAKDDKEEEPQTTETSMELFQNINYYHVHEDSLITDTEFVVFHCLVYEAIEKWITSEDAKKHPFTITWSKWKCLGLNHHQPFQSLRHILGIEDLTGYISEISSCPDIHKYIGWTWEAKDLRYWVVPREHLDDTHTAETSQITLHNMTTELALLKTKFDVSLKDFNNRLANYHLRLEQNDLQIKTMAKSLQVSLQQVIESSKVSIQGTMEAQKDIFQRKLTHIMDNNVKDFKSMLRGTCNTYETEIQRREQIFYGNLEGIADKVMEKNA